MCSTAFFDTALARDSLYLLWLEVSNVFIDKSNYTDTWGKRGVLTAVEKERKKDLRLFILLRLLESMLTNKTCQSVTIVCIPVSHFVVGIPGFGSKSSESFCCWYSRLWVKVQWVILLLVFPALGQSPVSHFVVGIPGLGSKSSESFCCWYSRLWVKVQWVILLLVFPALGQRPVSHFVVGIPGFGSKSSESFCCWYSRPWVKVQWVILLLVFPALRQSPVN